MANLLRIATAFAAGAAAMYLLDPRLGRSRRSRLRDRAVATGHDAESYARGQLRHAVNHVKGTLAEARSQLGSREVGDDQLHERIRAELGHLVERPRAIEVAVASGHVRLRGEALAGEIEPLLSAVADMPGVRDVDNRLGVRVLRSA
ncbi:BON domain-containing protein [Luteimonas sp. RD2P54]|uniref:BON domain-containing protein n=1 Tax=Luteimonas endophytica TaxID=3042023 RepID=A0ABT6J7B1_9GAMM|nr:BON domain-containing protein [Luteimonas endophytica]MDH5822716.1 BON domain-containing protein [Luteimonas endophytica]